MTNARKTINAMKSLDFTLKDIITYTAFIFALGGNYAANAYNVKVLEQEMRRSNEINTIRTGHIQDAVGSLMNNMEANRLNLRKLELEVAEIKYKRQ